MNSIELLRRYAFFAGFSTEHLSILAKISEELPVDAGHYFFWVCFIYLKWGSSV